MNMRAENMLQSVSEHLSCQPREYLKPKLAKLSENSIPGSHSVSPSLWYLSLFFFADRHMSSFIWDTEKRFPEAPVPMEEGNGAASFAVTPMILEFHNMFKSTLDGLQRELRRISHGLKVQPKDDSIESAKYVIDGTLRLRSGIL